MPKPKIDPETPVEHHWICEGCGAVNIGVDPPDECRLCAHPYHENLADQIRERDAGQLH